MKTNRLPNSATPTELLKAHKVKMLAKKNVRQRMHEDMSGPVHIQANLSVNHPDYGLSIEQHLAEKANRAQQGN